MDGIVSSPTVPKCRIDPVITAPSISYNTYISINNLNIYIVCLSYDNDNEQITVIFNNFPKIKRFGLAITSNCLILPSHYCII